MLPLYSYEISFTKYKYEIYYEKYYEKYFSRVKLTLIHSRNQLYLDIINDKANYVF